MPKVCDITGKKTISGHRVSHANNKTKRTFCVNLQKKKFYLQEIGAWVLLRVSTSAIRTINKLGLLTTMKKALKKGTLSPHLTHLVSFL